MSNSAPSECVWDPAKNPIHHLIDIADVLAWRCAILRAASLVSEGFDSCFGAIDDDDDDDKVRAKLDLDRISQMAFWFGVECLSDDLRSTARRTEANGEETWKPVAIRVQLASHCKRFQQRVFDSTDRLLGWARKAYLYNPFDEITYITGDKERRICDDNCVAYTSRLIHKLAVARENLLVAMSLSPDKHKLGVPQWIVDRDCAFVLISSAFRDSAILSNPQSIETLEDSLFGALRCPASTVTASNEVRPVWDEKERTLRFGEWDKWARPNAAAVVALLQKFEASGWPKDLQVDDSREAKKTLNGWLGTYAPLRFNCVNGTKIAWNAVQG